MFIGDRYMDECKWADGGIDGVERYWGGLRRARQEYAEVTTFFNGKLLRRPPFGPILLQSFPPSNVHTHLHLCPGGYTTGHTTKYIGGGVGRDMDGGRDRDVDGYK